MTTTDGHYLPSFECPLTENVTHIVCFVTGAFARGASKFVNSPNNIDLKMKLSAMIKLIRIRVLLFATHKHFSEPNFLKNKLNF